MAAFIINWCKIVFTQNSGAIRVRTASCQSGAVSAIGKGEGSPVTPIGKDASVKLQEDTIFLNRREASFINKEVRRLLKAQVEEAERKKKQGIPQPPKPGKITYAVYH